VEGHLLVLVAHTIQDDEEDGQPIEVIRIISARRLTGRKGNVMSKKFVKRTVNLAKSPA